MAHPKSAEAKRIYIDSNPFLNMKISDTNLLNELDGRNPCPNCGKSRKYFCYTCYVPISKLSGKLPQIKLPIKIDIIKHRNEIDGKSTASHAAILAPNDVTIYTFPDIPNYDMNERIVLIFPSANACSIQQLIDNQIDTEKKVLNTPTDQNHGTLMKEFNKNMQNCVQCLRLTEKLPIDRAVFIDSTWNQSRGIYKDARIKKLPCVVIQNRISQFWRHQKDSPRWYLATIEAIHQFLIEIHSNAWGVNKNYFGIKYCLNDNFLNHSMSVHANAYNGQYDNILFFFKHMYNLIHSYYDHDKLYAYKRSLM